MAGAQEPESVSTKCQQIAELARRRPGLAFTSLAHHIDVRWLYEAYRRTRKDAAAGVDGQSAQAYERDLAANLSSLLERAKSGSYRAPPVRRVYIPKADGSKRPIGIPTFEDKILQRAVAMLLEAIFEQDFHADSYGFRPGRSAHQALATLHRRLAQMGGGWVLELDIRSYFDTIAHARLQALIQQRVKDGVIIRLIGKWLNAGVLEDGQWTKGQLGSPQGGVISPLLANYYLHHVLDQWFEQEVKPRLQGRASMIRYADDGVLVFSNEQDARRVLEVLPKRFARYGLELHPSKTRLVHFTPRRDEDSSGTFDLLGFTHYWGKSQRGAWTIKRKTARDRFRRALKQIAQWCRSNRHQAISAQWQHLSRMIRGHIAYYGIRGNVPALKTLRYRAGRTWAKWLMRRSQREIGWDKLARLFTLYPLPKARIMHV